MTGYLFAAACAVLLCACYGAGRAALPPRWTAAVAAGAVFVPAAQFAIRPGPRGMAAAGGFAAGYLVFAALPLMAGRYVAQQRKVADQERLRIARDMHDSLGRRLSLAAVEAAALEVSELPAPQHHAVTRLATAIRASVTELHEILGVLRGERAAARGMPAADGLIEEFRAAGVAVSLRLRGTPRLLPPRADEAAYRVIEEGLTNAVRHTPGQPVTITVAWQPRALLIMVTNAADRRAYIPGSGLTDLAGRLRHAGGSLTHDLSGGQFRLQAVLPAAPVPDTRKRPGAGTVGLIAGILLLVILPATVLLGAH